MDPRSPIGGVFAACVALLVSDGLGAIRIATPPEQAGPRIGITAPGDDRIRVSWDSGGGSRGAMTLNTSSGLSIEELTMRAANGVETRVLAGRLTPFFSVITGTREQPKGHPPEMSIWNTFFDNPGKRPHATHDGKIAPQSVRFEQHGDHRASVIFDGVTLGPFAGELWLTVYAGSPLVQIEAVVSTSQDKIAFVFEAGLLGERLAGENIHHLDTEGRWQRALAGSLGKSEPVAARHRAIFADGAKATLALFPAPHQFFFPVDITTNNRTVWRGPREGAGPHIGFGVRQDPKGGGNFVPWCNAPPESLQRLGLFLLLSPGGPEVAMAEVLRFTRGDRFAELPGHTTFTTHYHMAVAVTAMERSTRGEPPVVPEFVKMFKDMGVRIVHLAEFHGDGHPRDPGPLRLPEMRSMFDECRRLSDDRLLLLPGEEGNDHLGIREPGKHPGHWMCLFPRPVYWTMVRAEGQPLIEDVAGYGPVYHVGSRADMLELLVRERGLAWTAHPRIKASSWTPDIFRREDFYLSDRWLGAAFKAMPADLSREKLGERCLDLLDDMANWGREKYLPGEVDVFKLDHTHELYGHMNINYLRLAAPPRFEKSWRPVLDALRDGAFFTTTGEVLIRDFRVGGRRSGETLKRSADANPEIVIDLEWTFPLKFAEVVSGDGTRVFRERVDLRDTAAFGSRKLSIKPPLAGRKWVRVEVWDIACNGAYTQPVWLE